MARITVEDCLSQIGNENRFALIHLAVERIKQHRKGQPFLVKCKNKEVVSTLREIATGDVSFDNLQAYDRLDTEEAAGEETAAETEEKTEETSA